MHPALGRPYRHEVEAARQRLAREEQWRHDLALRCAKSTGNLYGPYLMPRNRPVMRITRQMALVLLGSALFTGLMLVWLAQEITKMLGL